MIAENRDGGETAACATLPAVESPSPDPIAPSGAPTGVSLGTPAGTPLAVRSTARVVVVMPAYNAARTLERTYADVPQEAVDRIILVDDVSHDETVEIARQLGL